jgi:phage tail-like protein
MADRGYPYGAFNFSVTVNGDETFLGGFSDVSGLNTELTIAEYRAGNDLENHVRKVAGVHKVGDVTLKRGVVDSTALWGWISQARTEGPAAKRDVTVTLKDESNVAVQTWVLTRVLPMKYTGPTFAAKGGSDVAIEELVLSVEKIEVVKV